MDLFTELERNQLRESFLRLIPHIDQIAEAFYERLFADFPHVRRHFKTDLTSQREKLVDTIAALLDVLNRPEQTEPALHALGRTHLDYGANDGVYRWVERTFVQIIYDEIKETSIDADRDEIGRLWTRLIHFVVVNMQEGSHTH